MWLLYYYGLQAYRTEKGLTPHKAKALRFSSYSTARAYKKLKGYVRAEIVEA